MKHYCLLNHSKVSKVCWTFFLKKLKYPCLWVMEQKQSDVARACRCHGFHRSASYQITKISFPLFKFIFIHVFWGGAHLLCATTSWFPQQEPIIPQMRSFCFDGYIGSSEITMILRVQFSYLLITGIPFRSFLMRCIYKSCHTFFPSQPPCLLPNSNSPTCIRSFEKCRGRKIWEMECILASAHQVWLLA